MIDDYWIIQAVDAVGCLHPDIDFITIVIGPLGFERDKLPVNINAEPVAGDFLNPFFTDNLTDLADFLLAIADDFTTALVFLDVFTANQCAGHCTDCTLSLIHI